jgi:hypothetical protein
VIEGCSSKCENRLNDGPEFSSLDLFCAGHEGPWMPRSIHGDTMSEPECQKNSLDAGTISESIVHDQEKASSADL